MTTVRLKTTYASDNQPRYYNGVPLIDLWLELEEALAALQDSASFPLEERLTLAEPAKGKTGEIDWYGPATTANTTPEILFQQYQALYNAISEKIVQHPSDLHKALKEALTIPDASALFGGPTGPVLAPWGHGSREGKLGHGDLDRQGPAEPSSTPLPPPPLDAPSQPQPVSTTVQIVSRRPLGPWQEWLLLFLGLVALILFLCMLPRLAGWFAALKTSCRLLQLHTPLWLLLFLGLLLVILGLMGPLGRYLSARSDRQRARAIGAFGGLLQVILAWNDRNDLDLHIICPDNGRIYYGAPEHQDGARLDHDANAGSTSTTNRPVESVVWSRNAMPGLYRVIVDPYQMRVSQTSSFRVMVLHNGRVILRDKGIARKGQRFQSEFKFLIPRS